MFNKLLDDGINTIIVAVLAYWYCSQQVCVRWQSSICIVVSFIGTGTRRGGLLSPALFSRYIRDLLLLVSTSGVGCNIGGLFVNVLAYANDFVILAPSWKALQQLLSILEKHITDIDMMCIVRKTVCMIFEPKQRSRKCQYHFPNSSWVNLLNLLNTWVT